MSKTDDILQKVQTETWALAEILFKDSRELAQADVQEFLRMLRSDLGSWISLLAAQNITADEFRSLIEAKVDLARMDALRAAGLAQVSIDTFKSGFREIVINTVNQAVVNGTDSPGPKLQP